MKHMRCMLTCLAALMTLSACSMSEETSAENPQATTADDPPVEIILSEEPEQEAPGESDLGLSGPPVSGGSGSASIPDDIYVPGMGGAPDRGDNESHSAPPPPSPAPTRDHAPAPEIPEDIPAEYAELLEEYADDPETQAVLLDMIRGQGSAGAPPAAAGPGYQKTCQAETTPRRTLLITCQDMATGVLTQATHPIGSDLEAALVTVAKDLSGPDVEMGIVETPLCFWSETVQITDNRFFSMCPEWEYRYSQLAEDAAANFDTGRIAHHAPQQMVLQQPYFLEVAIQPLQKESDQDSVDESLTAAMGTGLAPDSEERALDLSFDTIRAGSVMSVSAVGEGYDILATTPQEQPLLPGTATVWQWQVTPRQPGTPLLTFTVSETVEVNGRSLPRTVKTIPLNISVTRLDDLLADTGPVDTDADTQERSLTSDTSTPVETLVTPPSEASGASLMNASSASGPDADIPGCKWVDGADPDRQAMVLSNLAYSPPVSRLAETHEDGERMTEALSAVGFSVLQCEDLGQRQTVRALSMLGRMAKARTDMGAHPVTFFYYSGHGVNIEGTNFILPTDIPGASPDDIRDMGVSFEQIFNRVSSTVAPTSFVVFDACRTVMDDQSRGLMRAYSPVGWASGVFQAFATEPGKTAADDGVYSEELASNLRTLPDPANVVFKRVQDAVAARTGQKQRPVYTDGTTGGDFYFKEASQ
ncbi:caspase family protein [Hyphomonas beringensis]|nr:caspase family protein [Hyphomonas beringensis]